MAGEAAKAGTGRLHVLHVCPQLILQNKTKRFYDGYITVCKTSYRIAIEIPDNNSLKDARIECGWKLWHLLRGYEGVIKRRLIQSVDLPSFLLELKSILEKLLECKKNQKKLFHNHMCTHIW